MNRRSWTVGRGPWTVVASMLAAACSATSVAPERPAPAPARPDSAVRSTVDGPRSTAPRDDKPRVAPPEIAHRLDLISAASTGVDVWRRSRPLVDGRGVLIAILDSGVDPGVAGLLLTSSGQPKLLDVRDFSGEGRVALRREGDRWVGVFREIGVGGLPQGDVNFDGDDRDSFVVDVRRGASGWEARVDTDGDGDLEDERPMADFLARRETFRFVAPARRSRVGPITGAINLDEAGGEPRLTLYLDTSGHGTHVAGIAAGYDMFGVRGFHGMAPGAQLLGLKIADNLRGGITTNGSMLAAMEYAVRFARERSLPLVINMSFGVGNAEPGRAVMDSIVDAFLVRHPDVVFTIAAGNEGPGTNTIGLPGSAEFALSVGATYPVSFARVQFESNEEAMGWWSSRGGAVPKPDMVAPGVAYSLTPDWKMGGEIAGGTSMAAPHVAGLAAVLVSGLRQDGRPVSGVAVGRALRASAAPLPRSPAVDQGAGLPNLDRAWQLLRGTGDVPRLSVRAMPARTTTGPGPDVAAVRREPEPHAAYRPNGLASAADTVQRFRVSIADPAATRRPRRFRLVSDAAWLRPATPEVVLDSATGSVVVEARYTATAFTAAGRYSGTLRGVSLDDSMATFDLLNTVVVSAPGPLRTSGTQRNGTAGRWYLRVAESSGPFAARLTVSDTTMVGQLSLFEPSGRPARAAEAASVGGADGKNGEVLIEAAHAVPGVWEVVLQAMPGIDLSYQLAVEPAAAPSPPERTWDTTFTAVLEGGVWRRPFTPPAWAGEMVLDVSMTNALWNRMTDFAVTAFDADGARVENKAFHYPWERAVVALPRDRAASWRADVEVFAAFALPDAPRTEVQVRLQYRAVAAPRP